MVKSLPKDKIYAMESTLVKMAEFDTVVLELNKSMEGKYNRAEAKALDKKFNEYVSKNHLREVEKTFDQFVKQPVMDTVQMDLIQLQTKIDGLVFKAYLDDEIKKVMEHIEDQMDKVVTSKRLENEIKSMNDA